MVEKRKNKTKKGFIVMQTPNKQNAYCVQRKVGNLVFYFFRKENGFGECVISKNLRKDYAYDNQGNETVVNDLDYQEIVKALKDQGMIEKVQKSSTPQQVNK